MRRIILFFFFLLLSANVLNAQTDSTQRINSFLSLMNMKYTPPINYSPLKSDFYFGCGAFLSPPIHYTLIKKDSNVVIGIYFGGPISHEEEGRIKTAASFAGRGFEMDSNYVYGARVKADTVNHKIVYLSPDFVIDNYKGDRGVAYVRNCVSTVSLVKDNEKTLIKTAYEIGKDSTYTILKIYNHNKIISVSKDGWGHIELNYLYTDAIPEKEIDKEIIATAKMLQFNN